MDFVLPVLTAPVFARSEVLVTKSVLLSLQRGRTEPSYKSWLPPGYYRLLRSNDQQIRREVSIQQEKGCYTGGFRDSGALRPPLSVDCEWAGAATLDPRLFRNEGLCHTLDKPLRSDRWRYTKYLWKDG